MRFSIFSVETTERRET